MTINSFRLVGITPSVTCPVAIAVLVNFHKFFSVLCVLPRLLRTSGWYKKRTNACCCCVSPFSSLRQLPGFQADHNALGDPSIHRKPCRHKDGAPTILIGVQWLLGALRGAPGSPEMFGQKKCYEHDTAIVIGTRQQHQVIVGVGHEEGAILRGG